MLSYSIRSTKIQTEVASVKVIKYSIHKVVFTDQVKVLKHTHLGMKLRKTVKKTTQKLPRLQKAWSDKS